MYKIERKCALTTMVVLALMTVAMYSHQPTRRLASGILASSAPGQEQTYYSARAAVETMELKTDSLPETPPAPVETTSDVDQLTKILEERLALPNTAQRIVYNSPCAPASKNLTGCTGTCGTAPQLDTKPLRQRVDSLVNSDLFSLTPEQRGAILSLSAKIPETDVIIVSASSSNHFNEMQAMFHSLHNDVFPVLKANGKNFSVVLFDLGLSAAERKLTEEKCMCHVVSFHKHIFPEHVKDNHCYSWKPIIIRSVMERARKYVVWQDSSIRWKDGFLKIFDNTERFGHQIVRYMASSRVTANTLKPMFDYMKEDVCPFFPYPEVQASVQLHHRDPLVVQAVLEPWCRCALEKQCICPAKPMAVLPCNHNKVIHRCHRFDQSALSIILAKLYASDMYKVMAPETNFKEPNLVSISREHKMPTYLSSL